MPKKKNNGFSYILFLDTNKNALKVIEEINKVVEMTVTESVFLYTKIQPIFRLKEFRLRELDLESSASHFLEMLERSYDFKKEQKELVLEALKKSMMEYLEVSINEK